MEKIFIDADGEVMGRVGAFCAKQALLGNEIYVFNCDKVIISGRKEMIIEDSKARRRLNTFKPDKGPYFTKIPEKIMKRAIRGMLPDFRVGRGKEAWRRIKCYPGIPTEFKKEKLIKINSKVSAETISLKELQAKL
jgi:large subunit ribosomal protein L13